MFGDKSAITIYDTEHSGEEDRFVTIGLSARGNLLVVIHSDAEHEMRIISARRATRTEVRAYVER